MKRRRENLLLALLLAAVLAGAAHAGERLVLIVSADSKVEQLDSLEVRKLFLGMTVVHNGDRLRPLINESDPRIKEVFLQNIVSMTEMTYDRRTLRLALQGGRPLPAVYTDNATLIGNIAVNPTWVSFAWERDVQHDRRLKILRVLWHD